MINYLEKYILFFLFIAIVPVTFAQTADNTNAIKDSVLLEKPLPSLNEFIESALKKSPLLQASDKQIDQIFEQIKIQKKSWADYLSLDATGRYGLYNQVTITDASTGGTDQLGIQSNKEQLNYYAGLTLKLPLSDFLSKKNEIKILKDNVEQRKFEKEHIKNELTQLVIAEYYKLVSLNKSMQLSENMLQSYSLNLTKAEKDVSSGIIGLSQYNSILVDKVKIEESYYRTQSEYFAQFYKIQVITGLNLFETK